MSQNAWCPECANPVVFESNPNTVEGIGVRCTRCGYRGEKLDIRLDTHPDDRLSRCKFCGAHNMWDTVGDVFGGPAPKLICRRCGGDQGQNQPPIRQPGSTRSAQPRPPAQNPPPPPAQAPPRRPAPTYQPRRRDSRYEEWQRDQAEITEFNRTASVISTVMIGVFAFLGFAAGYFLFSNPTWAFTPGVINAYPWADFVLRFGPALIFPLFAGGFVIPWMWPRLTGRPLTGIAWRKLVDNSKIWTVILAFIYIVIFIILLNRF